MAKIDEVTEASFTLVDGDDVRFYGDGSYDYREEK